MNKSVISVIGVDSPGVIYTISDTLLMLSCTFDAINQTVLKNQFAAIFIITKPNSLTNHSIYQTLLNNFLQKHMEFHVTVYPLNGNKTTLTSDTNNSKFIVTVKGPNSIKLIVMLSKIIAHYNINIEHLTVTTDNNPQSSFIICKTTIPSSVNKDDFHNDLKRQAQIHAIDISIQHLDIFETMHHIPII